MRSYSLIYLELFSWLSHCLLEYFTPPVALEVDFLWGGGIVKVTFHCSGGQVELVWPHWNMAAGSLAGSLPHSVIHSLGQPGGLTNQPHALEKKKKYADYLMSWTLETLEIRNFKSLTAKDLLRKWVNFSQFLSPK